MADTQPTAPSLPRRLSERYVIERHLGHGETAAVFRASDRVLRRQVAIKIFNTPANTAAELQRQESEAKVLASLNHYAVTTLLDAGVDSSDPEHPQVYLVMEYVPGVDLRTRLRGGPLPWEQVCWLGHDLSEGLQALHDLGFQHRDVQPANILVAARDADSRLRGKLTDFGFATIIGSRAAFGYSMSEAATYLSPEQADDAPATAASDIYSLALVLLESGTGQPAFPGTVERSLLARLTDDPAIPESVPAGIAEILRAMTARRPGDRMRLAEVAERFQNLNIDALVRRRRFGQELTGTEEARRLAAVRRYNVLDTPPEPAYDRVTRLVSRSLRVPLAAIGIFDVDRVWVKSRVGVEVQELDSTGTASPVGKADDEPWTIPDTRADPETSLSPLVTNPPHVRSFAAAPLFTHDGHPIGALYAADLVPREFTALELDSLRDFAGIVMNEMELRLSSRRALFERR